MTVALIRLAARGGGGAGGTSLRKRSMISWRGFCNRSYDALTTSCRYWLFGESLPPPFEEPYRAVLLKIHCVVVSSRVTNGSDITSRSNQRWTPVMGAALSMAILRKAEPLRIASSR